MTHDLRLVPGAAVAWLAAAVLLTGSSGRALAVSLAAVAATALLWSAAPGRGRSRALALVALCLAAVAASCAWRLADVAASPLVALAEQRQVVDAEVQVVLDARTFERFGSESSVARVRVLRAGVDGRVLQLDDRATMFLDEPAPDLVTGRRVSVRARLGPSERSDEGAVLDVLRRTPSDGAAWWWEGSERLRVAIRAAVAHAGPAEAALVPALVAGDDAALPAQVEEEFRRTGLTHLLAVSGTNLTIVLAVLLALARTARAPPRVLVVVGLLGVVGFVLLARPEPSVLRAAGMGVVGLAAITYGGRGGLRALAIAVLVLLLVDPWLSTSTGFVLSVCATGGILVGAPPMARRLRHWMPHWVALAVAVPLAAQLACTPAIAAISGEVSMVAVAANLLAGPAVAPATVAGLLGGLAELCWSPAGRLVGTVAALCAGWIVGVGHHAAALPGAAVPWTAPWWLLVPCVPVVGWLLWRWAHRPVVVLGLCLGLGVALWRPPQPGWPPPGWLVVACDVGQGDATVLRVDDGSAVVVDVGPEGADVDRCLTSLGVERLVAVVLTHDHADHVGGWDGAVAGRGDPVALVGTSGGAPVGVPSRALARGDALEVGPWDLRVVWPPAGDQVVSEEPEGSAANDASVTLLARARGVRVLLTGDLEPGGQDAVLRSGVDVGADVLKMPHHGSARQSERFIAAVAPRVVTVSAGEDNDYGHPAPAALGLLRQVGARWWRTDLQGDIAIVDHETGLSVVTRSSGGA